MQVVTCVCFCIPASIKHEASVCSGLCFNSSWWIVFPSYSRACLLLYFNQTPLYPVADRALTENGTMLTTLLECVCLCWSATTVLVAQRKGGEDGWMEGRRGDEGGMGEALQIRSNYSSPPPYCISAAPHITSDRPIIPLHFWVFCRAVFPPSFSVFSSLSVHFSKWCLRWEPRPSRLLVSPSAITSLTLFFCIIIAHSSRWK